MNKLFSKVAALSVGLAMAIGVGVAVGSKGVKEARAEDVVFYTLDGTTTGGSSGYDTESDITQDGMDWKATGNTTMSPWRIGGKSLSAVDRTIYSVSAMGSAITKMELNVGAASSVTVNSLTLIVASDASYETTIDEISGTFATNSKITFAPSGSATSWAKGAYYKIVFNITISGTSNKFVEFKSAKFYCDGSTPLTYTVTYNANGGTGTLTDSHSPYNSGATVTVLSNTFTYDGYSFVKWNTLANGKGTDYAPGATFSISANTTLYAQWDLINKYTDDTEAKTITWNLALPSYSSAAEDEVSWESPRVTMVATKEDATTATNNYLPPSNSSSRFYKDSLLTFTPVGEDDILKIEATATTDGYATALADSTWTNAVAAVSGTDTKLVVITATDGSNPVSATVGGTAGLTSVVVYYGTAVPVVVHSVIDEVEHGSLNVSEIADGATLTTTISPDDGYGLPTSASASIGGETVASTYSNGVITVQNVTGDVTIEAECVKLNPIQNLYTKSSGYAVNVYGYYVGFLDGTGPVIMDGAYGIVIFDRSADVSGYTEGTTILHVTGSISIYKGLYEIGSATHEKATGTYETPSIPVVYTTNGSETAEYASRLTTVTGTPALVSGSFDDAAGTNDIKMNFTVGTSSVEVFYKKDAQTADATTFAAMKAAVAGSTEITIKGFTSWYNKFQVQMNGYVPPAEGYTAEDFAQDLLDQTDAVCTGWKEGDNNHDAIEAIWSDLASNDKYPSLPSDQKTILAEAVRDEGGSVVEQAMARYDYLTGRYNLSNFINGRTPIPHSGGAYVFSEFFEDNSSAIIIIALVSVSAIGLAFALVFKKKKQK